jgi:hypothetical protein
MVHEKEPTDKVGGEGVDDKAKAGKQVEDKSSDKKFTEAEVQALIKKESDKVSEKFKDFDTLKAELEALKKEKMNDQEKAVLEAKEAAKKEFEPEKERLSKLGETINTLLELELKDIPEEKLGIIPDYDKPEQKLEWVKKAKASGFFDPEKPGSTSKIPAGGTPDPSKQDGKTDLKDLAEKNPKEYFRQIANKYGRQVSGFFKQFTGK